MNQYKADPFVASVVKHPSPAAGPNNYLPAGDTHIYPVRLPLVMWYAFEPLIDLDMDRTIEFVLDSSISGIFH